MHTKRHYREAAQLVSSGITPRNITHFDFIERNADTKRVVPMFTLINENAMQSCNGVFDTLLDH